MDAVSIIRALSALAIGVAGAAGLVALVALQRAEFPVASGLLVTAGVGAFVGASLRIMTAGRPSRGGVREALAFALLAWIVTPALAAPPFLAAGAGDGLRAYADALSAATTTGAAPFFIRDGAEGSAILWWNLVQWAGGAGTVMTSLIVLASINLTGPGLHRSPLFTLEPERLFDRFAPVGRAVIGVYALGTIVAFVLIRASGMGAGDAAAMALAGVATGGLLLPGGVTDLAGAPPLAGVAAMFALLFGSFNFALHFDFVRGRNFAVYAGDAEARALMVFFALAALAVVAAVQPPGVGEAARAVVQGAAIATTAAWDLGLAPPAAGGVDVRVAVIPALVMALVIIGGSPASTAGGVKLMRIVLLARQAGGELTRLAIPSAVHELTFRGEALPPRAVTSMLAYVLAYAAGLGGLMLAFGLSGGDFEAAAAAASAAIANAGPALTLAAGSKGAELLDSTPALATFCVGMILGRVEVFAAFAALAPGFWRD